MPDPANTLLNILSQFTGGRGGAPNNVVSFVIAGFFWSVLLSIAIAQHRRSPQPREALLRWGFAVALGRELFMLGVRLCSALELVDAWELHVVFPPLEHAMGTIAQVIVAAGFMRFLVPESPTAGRYLRIGVGLNVVLYLATFWWWGRYISAHRTSSFGKVWCDVLFHINASTLDAVAAIWLARRARGQIRNVICTALMCLFTWDFLKLPDIAFNEAYVGVFHPIAQLFHLAAIPLFGFVYVSELVTRRADAERKVVELAASLEARVAARTADLEEAAAWRRRAESVEQARTRQALELQQVLYELAKRDKSDFTEALRSLLKAASTAMKVERVSFWAASPEVDSITCRLLYSGASNGFVTDAVVLEATICPAYFSALRKMTQIVADDARMHRDTREFTESYLVPLGITSMLDVPVWQQGGLAGILCCEHVGAARQWTQPEVEFALAIAEMLALALESAERKRVELALALEQRRQAAIVELEAAINQEDALQGVLDRIAETVTLLLPATASSVVLWDPVAESFTVSSSTVPGQPAQAGARRVRRFGGASRAIVDTLGPVIAPDIRKDPYGANSLLDQFGMHAYAGVPLLADGKAHGVLYAIDREVRHYTPQEVTFLAAVASRAANALMKFRLIESLKESNLRLAEEVTVRRRAEERISASLREKESLLQEIHHRVKNNLQIVSSLLNLQSRDYADPVLQTAFAESQQRIRSMALIHEMLYRSNDLAEIDFGDYLRMLVPALMRSYSTHAAHVRHEIQSDDIKLRPQAAVPLGLIVNELITNSLKHGFVNRTAGNIAIECRRREGRTIELKVSDDGVGLPPEFCIGKMHSLGLRLVAMMASQIAARVESHSHEGASFTLTFELTDEPSRSDI